MCNDVAKPKETDDKIACAKKVIALRFKNYDKTTVVNET